MWGLGGLGGKHVNQHTNCKNLIRINGSHFLSGLSGISDKFSFIYASGCILFFVFLNFLSGFLVIVSSTVDQMFSAQKHGHSKSLQYTETISVVGDFDTTYKHNVIAPAHVNVFIWFP